ncbi:hypothetical protein, partial [Nonomuraea rubra]|uniref:hypothetical protein n=1 Tax=Nonomuraea rubra TaxID=46180 RepID=UPI0031EAF468
DTPTTNVAGTRSRLKAQRKRRKKEREGKKKGKGKKRRNERKKKMMVGIGREKMHIGEYKLQDHRDEGYATRENKTTEGEVQREIIERIVCHSRSRRAGSGQVPGGGIKAGVGAGV